MLDRDEEMCLIYNSALANRYESVDESDNESDYEEVKTKIYNPSTLEKTDVL